MTVTDEADGIRIETVSTQVGEVATGARRLLALQPGIVPMTTQTAESIIVAGAAVAILPSGGLNAGEPLNLKFGRTRAFRVRPET
jgi:hypothetical protein